MKKYAIIVAGGKGLRMGGSVPKQFIPVKGRPILMRTLEAFHAYDTSVELILVLPASQKDYWDALCHEYHFLLPYRFAEGGETRFHSVSNGLSLVPDDERDALVAVHDGVRPFVSRSVIETCYDIAYRKQAAIPVVEVVDTLRYLFGKERGESSETVDRSRFRLVQTPQTFRADVLKAAYAQPYRPDFTDDASVAEAAGTTVYLVDGNRENIKITTPFDLKIAEMLLSEID
ncbi:MAG: 2-C-methyl-D-erythritol 4-phosphate cytidylyltransferase [Paraprevotella sp.]|nr:2-C-methyl-D-erythritol 4-phosphate cytidylyltransferase [Paraprevotella sp.]